MIQRSPTYVVSRPSEDSINKVLKKFLPIKLTYFLVRWKNILWQSYTFFLARTFPQKIKTTIINLIKEELGEGYDVKKHFTPSYNPWDQRVCLVPDSDLFRVIKNQKASVVTDTIKQFDDKRVSAHKRLTYKGMMLSGVPNFALSFGYVNASWTLRADLTCEYVCKLINMMDKKRAKTCMPVDDKSAYGSDKLIDFNSGYVQRGLSKMPQQGNRAPWKNYQNYLKDIFSVRWMPIKDSNLKFLDIED